VISRPISRRGRVLIRESGYLPGEFALDPDICYLNHAAVAPWPKRTALAVERFARENMLRGASDYPRWLELEQRLRERAAWLIGAPSPDDIALLKNTSEGLSFVAGGLDWSPGERIVGISDDFPSNRVVWESLAARGVHFDKVDVHTAADPEQALIDALRPETRLMAVSSVHFATGLRFDLARLSAACRERGVLLCIDAIQALGALPFDLREVPADFVVADGHKWMLGPEGLALFYVNPAIRDRLRLLEYGWAMREASADYGTGSWQIARSARRFECGSPNMLGIHGLEASLSLLQEVGMESVAQHLYRNVRYLREGLSALPGVRVVTPAPRERHAGILAFAVEGIASEVLYRRLMARQVICACRGGFVRFSPHFHTREATLERTLEILREEIAACNARSS